MAKEKGFVFVKEYSEQVVNLRGDQMAIVSVDEFGPRLPAMSVEITHDVKKDN